MPKVFKRRKRNDCGVKLDIFMSYGEYGQYKSSNIRAERFDANGMQRMVADTLERIGLNGFRYSGLAEAGQVEKEVAEEAAKSGIAIIGSKKAVGWAKALCAGNPKLRSLAQGFIVGLALKHSGMPYKVSGSMFKGGMPKAEGAARPDEMGFAIAFGGSSENTAVKKISLKGTQPYEVGYFLAGVHNAAIRLLIRSKGVTISPMQKETKDMKRLADALTKSGLPGGFEGFVKIITICSAYDVMPFPMQRQFLKIYKDLPKPRRMGKVSQPIESFI